MKQIVPNLWFDTQAEDAARFYTSVFDDSKILRTDHYTDAGKEIHGHVPGDVMSVEFELRGQRFIGINGGSIFTITPAISFFVRCRTAGEVDDMWTKLSDGATVMMPLDAYPFSERYGWLSDKFGVSWQIMLAEGDANQNIVPSLMFTNQQCGKAEEALQFYASVFHDSQVGTIARYSEDQDPDKAGTVSYGEVTLEGYMLAAMDSARMHDFGFSEGVSLMVEYDTQADIDYYWGKLSAVPEAEQCGWLKDKYGVSWQIVPTVMTTMFENGTPEQIERVTGAFMQMKKLDIAELERAYRG